MVGQVKSQYPRNFFPGYFVIGFDYHNRQAKLARARMRTDWYPAFPEGLRVTRTDLAETGDVTRHWNIIRRTIQTAIEGSKPADVIAQAHKEFQEMLDKTEK
jgi:hypothetical protein